MPSDLVSKVSLFGLALSTHRPKDLGAEASSYFQYEPLIAAISILFFRTTVSQKNELAILRWFFALLLAGLAYCKKSYELILAVEIFSYAVPWVLQTPRLSTVFAKTTTTRLLSIAASAFASLVLAHVLVSDNLFPVLGMMTPSYVVQTIRYLFPVEEISAAYDIMKDFADPIILRKQIDHLFFVTFHIQVGMGFLGISFLRKEQHRRNLLIRMDVADTEDEDGRTTAKSNGSRSTKDLSSTEAKLDRAKRFQGGAAPFILFSALPYMFQIISYGNINKFAFTCVQHDLHRTVRLNELFDYDNRLTAMATESPTSPEGKSTHVHPMQRRDKTSKHSPHCILLPLAYANSMNSVVSTAYEIFNRKLFSLPKVLLLPGVMSRQPMLVLQVFPFIFVSDWLKANAVSFMTTKIEELQKELSELRAVRSKVESFDIKNAELLQRSGPGAMQFTQHRWEEFTVQIQARVVVSDLLSRSKGFFAFIQRNFVFSVLIDCALANLIAIGKIMAAEIFVFSRAIEDAVDMVLMRSRGEAELARMMTEIEKLKNLVDIWDRSTSRSLIHCNLAPPKENNLVLRNLHYSRGTASARADHVELKPGVYALTGANGSGKSTLFRVLMSCNTNQKSIDLPPSINLLTPMEPLTEVDDLLRETACEAADADCDTTAEVCESDLGESRKLNEKELLPADMPQHVPKLSITMPSAHVVEISQNFYWPLYSTPIDWIFQEHVMDTCTAEESEVRARRVAEELHSLDFFQAPQMSEEEMEAAAEAMVSPAATSEGTIQRIMSELQEEKEDWFSDLSGGQKSKVELVRLVFLQSHCPDVLLIDETMAPLDPASKSLVMAKLKVFCSESIILVIYHTDVGRGTKDSGDGEEFVECVPSNDFFNKNLHLEKGLIHVRDTC
jgi:energy-coupling factor transporter ATP-binding protein EcfA2